MRKGGRGGREVNNTRHDVATFQTTAHTYTSYGYSLHSARHILSSHYFTWCTVTYTRSITFLILGDELYYCLPNV